MMPRLGKKYEIQTEFISKPRAEYQTDEYFELDLPGAPAVMVGDEIVVEGSDVAEHKLENVIRNHLALPPLEPEKKGVLGRLFGR
jgi:hypothetical protein